MLLLCKLQGLCCPLFNAYILHVTYSGCGLGSCTSSYSAPGLTSSASQMSLSFSFCWDFVLPCHKQKLAVQPYIGDIIGPHIVDIIKPRIGDITQPHIGDVGTQIGDIIQPQICVIIDLQIRDSVVLVNVLLK